MEDTDLQQDVQLRKLASSALIVGLIGSATSLVSWALGVHPWALIGSATSLVETMRRARTAAKRHETTLVEGLMTLAFFAGIVLLLWTSSR